MPGSFPPRGVPGAGASLDTSVLCRGQIPALPAACPRRCGIWRRPSLRLRLQGGFKLAWLGGISSLLGAASAFTFTWCCPRAWHKGQCHPRCSHPVCPSTGERSTHHTTCDGQWEHPCWAASTMQGVRCKVQDTAGTSLLGCHHHATGMSLMGCHHTHRITHTEFSELEGTSRDHQVQLIGNHLFII